MNMKELSTFTKVKDLIYYDGPLMSLFQDNKGNKWIYYWVDANNDFNIWLIYPATEEHIAEFDNVGAVWQIRENILKQKHVYLVDIDDDAEIHNFRQIATTEIPEDYLPVEVVD